MASDSTGWPVLEERALPLGQVRRATKPRRKARSRSPWLVAALAFVCGALVSAAVFTIGWRHQTQQNTAAESALAKETARVHSLSASLAAARATGKRERRIAADAQATVRRLERAGAAVAAQAGSVNSSAGSVSSGATGISSATTRLTSELKTLTTYLTTTPTSQLDPGYIGTQATYLNRQLDALQSKGADLGGAAASFDAAARKLGRLASALGARN